MQSSEDVMDVLETRGILQRADDRCTHCGCLWSSQNDSEFCLRCRSHFFFSLPPSVSSSPKRVRVTNQRQLTYCWCETCETFHWLAYSFSPPLISILSLSTQSIIPPAMSSSTCSARGRFDRVAVISPNRRNNSFAPTGRLFCFIACVRHAAYSAPYSREFRSQSPRSLRSLSETVDYVSRSAKPNRRRQTRHRSEPRE